MTVPAIVSLLSLGVRDLARATAFYEALGWRRSSASVEGNVSFFHTTGTVVALYGLDDMAADAGLPRADALPEFRGVALAINVGSEPEVDAVLAAAEAAGGRILAPAGRAPWGGWTGHFADTEGWDWEVAHNPGFPLRADGTVVLPD
jgi:predicted enzyme related to lactoylglutathione lyase